MDMKKRVSGIFAPISTPFVDEEASIEQMRDR
jgi:hypothetical protein